jgi:hypothetical protein
MLSHDIQWVFRFPFSAPLLVSLLIALNTELEGSELFVHISLATSLVVLPDRITELLIRVKILPDALSL